MRLVKLTGFVAAASLALGSAAFAQQSPSSDGAGSVDTRQSPREATVPSGRPIWLGIEASPVPPALARQLRLEPGNGLMIDRVDPGSPAEKAGISQYDVIQKLDDHAVADPKAFLSSLRHHQPGDAITLSVIREGQPKDLKVILAENPAPRVAPTDVPDRPDEPSPAPKHHSHGLQLPKINVRVDHGDLVATDESGHVLFRQPLDFTLDNDDLPFTVHIRVKPDRLPDMHQSDPHDPAAPPDRPQP
jgi:membrane-associated protease RseP (regulator of RpoE activity)